MPPAAVIIRRYETLDADARLSAGLDAVFFAASNTKSFAGEAARSAFRQRWLGRYLQADPRWAYVALNESGTVVGYLVGSIDDPARTPRFADLAYFSHFAHLTPRYPAQLHVNVAEDYRGAGLGGRLIEAFVEDLRAAGIGGVHAVTSKGARNAGFYERQGFRELASSGSGVGEVVFLARDI